MDFNPRVSIITVTFNAASVIEKTLISLKCQSFKDFEHIIIDGNSTDSTLQLVNKYKFPNSIVISEPDRGLYDAMNKGLALANGDYVIFLNAGDAFHSSDSLEKYMKAVQNNPDIIYGDTCIVNNDSQIIGRRHLSPPEKLDKNSFLQGMLICHQAFMVKKELTDPYNLKYRFSADYDWCIRCIDKSSPERCVNLSAVTIDYLSEGLTDKNKVSSLKERFRIMAAHYGLFKAVMSHISFIPRAIKRRIKRQSAKKIS